MANETEAQKDALNQAGRDAYLAALTDEERARVERLWHQRVPYVSTDLICADCNSPMIIRVGRFGRFYGCIRYKETGCRGSISAFENGKPKGWPGNAATRAARSKVIQLLETEIRSTDTAPYDFTQFRAFRESLGELIGKPRFSVGELTEAECNKLLENWEAIQDPAPARIRILRLNLEDPGDWDE